MRIDFRGKFVLITGGSKGIGQAIARELVSRGSGVFLIARGCEALENTQRALLSEFPDASVATYSCDVSNYGEVEAAVAAMIAKFGRIDGVINNAGYAIPRYFEEIEPSEFERHMQVDYLGSVYVTKAAAPHLQTGAFVTFTSSVAGYLGVFGYTSYCPAKFAQIGFAEALQQEFAPKGIHVAVLCPPDTATPGFDEENQTKPFETRELGKSARLMQPNVVARRYLDKLARGKFLINVNVESSVIYRLHGMAPELTRRMLNHMVRAAQRKKTSGERR